MNLCLYSLLKTTLFLLCLYLLGPLKLTGQDLPDISGARAAALGMASATLSDIWSVQNNIGALAGFNKAAAGFSYNTRLNLPELTTLGVVLALPLQKGMAAASLSRYGTGAYRLQEIGLGYSHKISFISVGIKLNYLQQSIENWESRGNLVLEAGGKAELLPGLHFGAHAYNLTQSSLSTETDEMIPILLKASLAYIPSKNLQLLVQTLKQLDFPARFSAGLEYRIIEAFHLRTGILTAPFVASFGMGYILKQFGFDYAFRYHSTIGTAHHLSINFDLPSLKKP